MKKDVKIELFEARILKAAVIIKRTRNSGSGAEKDIFEEIAAKIKTDTPEEAASERNR